MDKSIKNNFSLDNYYNLFDITNSSSTKQIIIAYKNKITKFNNIKQLSQNQINDIKLIKTGLYILINPQIRIIYDKILNKRLSNTITDNVHTITDNVHTITDNNKQLNTLDALFNIDNSWMNNETQQEYISKKNKNESNIVGDRIFSLSHFNKRPSYSSECESQLRKPQQGRIEKT